MTSATGQGDLRLEVRPEPSPTAEGLSFLFSDPRASPRLGQDPEGRSVLEVIQIWRGQALEMRHLQPGAADLTLGGAGQTFTAPSEDLPGGPMPLFDARPEGYRVWLRPGWTGFIEDPDGGRVPLADLPGLTPADARGLRCAILPGAGTLWLDTGHVRFAARHVAPGWRKAAPVTDGLDYPFLGVLSVAASCAALLAVALLTAPAPVEAAVAELPDRITRIVMQAPPPAPTPTPKAHATNQPEGERAKGAEGKVGKKDSPMKVAKGDKVALRKRAIDREIAENAGILGHMSDEGALAGVFGDSALSADLSGGIGGLLGAKGVAMGSGGLGSRGSGLGGNGRAETLGGVGTRGRHGGDGTYGEVGGGPKTEGHIGRLSGDVITLGALDKSLIDAVVKQQMNALRYCYQRELTRDPGLAGKVSVRFVIAGDGSVSKASIKRSSLGNAAVEDCLTDRFLRMRFPAPKGGGIVMVTYPFLFSAG